MDWTVTVALCGPEGGEVVMVERCIDMLRDGIASALSGEVITTFTASGATHQDAVVDASRQLMIVVGGAAGWRIDEFHVRGG